MASSTDLHLRLLIDANGNAAIQEIGRVRTGVANVGTAAATATTATSGMMQSIVGLGAGVFAIDRIASAIGSMVTASAEAARAATKLETGLANAGGATASQVDGLKELAQALQDVTGYDGDATIAAQARLATYGLTADEIARLTPGLLDMAEAARKSGAAEADLEGIAKALGKARTQGVEALRKYGVAVTEVQAAEFEAASDMERTALLVDLLSERFGGLAAAVGSDFDGAIRRASAAQGDLAEAMGDLVTQGEGGNAFMDTYTAALKTATAAISDNADGLRTLLGDAGYTAVGAALIYAATQGAKWVAGQREQAAAATTAAEAARMEALAVASSARSKELAASGSLAIARAVEAEAAATLANVRALAAEQPYLVRTASYQAQLTAARKAHATASAALVAAETAYSKALAGSATAAEAAEAAATKQALTWKTLTSGTTLLNAAMTAMIGLEVGRWLRGLAEDSEIGRRGIAGLDTALGALSETYRLAVEAEQRKADTDARVAAGLKAVSDATGLAIGTTDEFNRLVESGQVVWNAQTSAWERGTTIIRGLAEGLGEVDTAYARVADVLERTAKLEEAQGTARQAQIKAAADAAKASGDEAAALELLSQARAADVAAAERQVEFQRALLAETESRIEQQSRETDATASGYAARQALLAQLQEEEAQRRTALALAEATVAQARVEADQAKAATQTYGDQSDSLDKLIARRAALTAAQQAGKDAMTQAAVAQSVLAAAQDKARATAEAYTQALLAGGDTSALQAGAQQAQHVVAALEAMIAKGAASAANAATVNRDLAATKLLISDAAKDAADNVALEIEANERALTIAQARLDVATAEIERQQSLATARGDALEATRLSIEADELAAEATRLGAEAKEREALALTEKARLTQIAAEATGGYTAEERAAVAAIQDAATVAGLEAEKLTINAKAKDDAVTASKRLTAETEAMGQAFADAGVSGVDAMADVNSAISSASKSGDLEKLGNGLRAAIQAGLDKAGELSAALQEVEDKLDSIADGDWATRTTEAIADLPDNLDAYRDEAQAAYDAVLAYYQPKTGVLSGDALISAIRKANEAAVAAAARAEKAARTEAVAESADAAAPAQTTVARATASPAATSEVVTRSTVDIRLTVVSGATSKTATLSDLDESQASDFIDTLRTAQSAST